MMCEMGSSDLKQITRQLCECIDIVMSVSSDGTLRTQANHMIDSFKHSNNAMVLNSVAINLITDTSTSSHHKHFAFQLLEHVIKFNWNTMDVLAKQQIICFIEQWFSNDNYVSMITESKHLLNSSSRCIIEVMMREWPQSWPNFLAHILSKQSYLTLYVIWQLAEDVGVFYLPSNVQRRREMNSYIIQNMSVIYEYICKCIVSNDYKMRLTSISTLNALLEWTRFDCDVLQILCEVFCFKHQNNEQSIQLKQCICDLFLLCFNRKPLKDNDKTTLKEILCDNNVIKLLDTIVSDLQIYSEFKNTFSLIKREIFVLSSIGQLIINHFHSNISIESWNRILQTMLSLFCDQNIVFNAISIQFWFCYVKHHSKFSINNSFDSSLMSNLLSNIPLKLIRPESDKVLIGIEFDSEEDYDGFYFKFRPEVIDLLRQLTALDEKMCFGFVSNSLSNALHNSNNNHNDWEIITQLLVAVCNRIQNLNQFSQDSQTLLQLMIDKINNDDPDLISSQLSCISALTVFLPEFSASPLLRKIIDKIFVLTSFNLPGQTKLTRTKQVKNLRRHAGSLFIKISQTFPKFLVPLFSELKCHIDTIMLDIEHFSQMEKCSLYEGLILISNEFSDIELQRHFLQELMVSINWITQYRVSVDQFIKDVGLDTNNVIETHGHKRATILYTVNLILGLIKRVTVERKNTLIPHIFPLINSLFPIMANLNAMWKLENQEKCHEYYRRLLFTSITEADKQQVLDVQYNSFNSEYNSSNAHKTDAYKMQIFIWALHEFCYNIVGTSAGTFKPDIYDNFSDFKLILNDLEFLPDWKLKMICKHFIKPLISYCPNVKLYHERILVSVITNMLPFYFHKINNRWEVIKARSCIGAEEDMKDESEAVESELIADQINRLLSREFVELMICLLLTHKSQKSITNESFEKTEATDNSLHISELGNYALQCIPNLIIMAVTKSLSWLDTTISIKTAQLNLIILQKIIDEGMIKSEDGALFLCENIINALCYFGEHDQNQSILLQLMLVLYEGITLKLGFESLKIKLSAISGSNIKDWLDFEERLIRNNGKFHIPDKKKKEALKKLLFNIIGKNMGQLYKYNRDEIRNLQPMFVSKNKYHSEDFQEDISLSLLFKND